MPLVGLGECPKCRSPLEAAGRLIRCSRCGTPAPDQSAADVPALVPAAPVIPPEHYAQADRDRLKQAEVHIFRVTARVEKLEAALARRK